MITVDPTTRYSRSLEAFERSTQVIAGGVNSNFRANGHPCPLTFSRAFGAHLIDVDGNDYVDYALGMGPLLLGHGHPAVNQVVSQALEDGQLFAGQHPAESELATLLVEWIPGAELVRLGQSGTEMDQLALRLARAYTGRRKFVRFQGHYHGWLDPLYLDPHNPVPPEDAIALPWNDLRVLEETCERNPDEIATIIMEPIMCNTGVILPERGYLEGVRELCDRWGIVLVFDEVITGFRVGLTGAQGMFGVVPDLATFAKAMGSGFPIAALVGRQPIMELLAEGRVMQGGTYNTGTTAVAAALATLGTLAEDDPYTDLARKGEGLMDAIEVTASRCGIELAVEGLGPVFHTRFGPVDGVHDATTYAERSDTGLRRTFVAALQDQGVRVTSRGTWFLSTAHSAKDLDATVGAVERALKSLEPAAASNGRRATS